MLLKEVIIDINQQLKQRQTQRDEAAREQRREERLKRLKARRKDKKSTDEIGTRRRSKLSTADQFRDIARQFSNIDKE